MIALNTVIPQRSRLQLLYLCIAFMLNLVFEHMTIERCNELRLGGKARGHLRTAILNVNLQLQHKYVSL